MIIENLWNLANKKRRRYKRIRTATKIAAGVGIATTAGIAVGILFVPKSGRAIRRDLETKALNSLDKMKDSLVKKNIFVDEDNERASNQAINAATIVHEKLEDVKYYIDKYFSEIK